VSVVDVGPPVGVPWLLALRGGEEGILQLFGHRSAVAGPDLPVVDLADRGELRRRSREEALVRVVEIGANEVLLSNDVLTLASQGDHRPPRDPIEAPGLGR